MTKPKKSRSESSSERSRIMRAVKARDTAPELQVRRLVFALGYRYRLHKTDLPGKPDLAFASRRSVIFVHGCFWHGHSCTRGARTPKHNAEYWARKIARNRARDRANISALRKLGWRTLVIWECQLRDVKTVQRRICSHLFREQR
jgi:DNA mismatch endonuclease (patch repair protein)